MLSLMSLLLLVIDVVVSVVVFGACVDLDVVVVVVVNDVHVVRSLP